ncbi:vacuolar protein sorting-associated protein 26C [Sitodiplosis mosellana]|uniref:vacuolar protein sorting-associated protein 26C n=1 Tax=Sitodiplosis mosellana TaxID=263140 RepID=UPI0024443BE3|nr:vacuolar protein sorting-associated protein 26C [Sitodiplosis mosellana]XP_055316807.1 vacuolar protein sorting-associated protein 26C [Sitodiplosis mosellana]
MAVSIEIKLNRPNKIYYENESISGLLQIHCPTETKHDGIVVALDGMVNLRGIKPFQLLSNCIQLAGAGKLSQGFSELAFEFELKCVKEILYETYHGVFININYMIKCEIKRSFLAKTIAKSQQFVIQYKPQPKLPPNNKSKCEQANVTFTISPETLQKTGKERISIPRFLITGSLDAVDCCISKPFTGHLTIQHTEVAIKSIDLQLLRIETCGSTEGYSRDATEVQTIQLADGNVCPKLEIPINFLFPRLFTCPTLISKNFKIEFELNLFVIFQDEYLVTENFPIVLHRFN